MAARKKTVTDLTVTEGFGGSEPMTFDDQLLRIAGNPAIPVPRLQEIARLRRELRMDDAIEAFNHAMVACQQEMRPIEANAENDQTKTKYATLYAVDKALRPIYSRYGFNLSFNTADCPLPNHLRVLCYVSRGIYTRTYQHDVAISILGPKGNAVMTPTHGGGSALSYGKRYLELMIFHITIGDPGRAADDDGNAAGGLVPIDPEQLAELIALADEAGADKAAFCRLMGVEGIALIPSTRFEEAKAQLNRKLRAQARKAATNA